MTPVGEQPEIEKPAGEKNLPAKSPGLPDFPGLLPMTLAVNGVLLGVLLLIRQNWLALGVVCGAMVGIALFWSLHLISRVLVDEFLQADSDRKEAKQFGAKAQADLRRASLWRLAGMMGLKYGGLLAVMIVVYHFAKSHLIPFFLAFLGAFALTQLSIVSAAARTMNTSK